MDDPIYLGMAVYHVVPKKKEKVKFLPSSLCCNAKNSTENENLLTEDHYIVYTHSRKENHINVNSSNEKVIYMKVYKYIKEWIITYKQKSIKTQICDLCIVNYQLYMLTVHNAHALTLFIDVIKDFQWKLISVPQEPPYKVFCITNCIWK